MSTTIVEIHFSKRPHVTLMVVSFVLLMFGLFFILDNSFDATGLSAHFVTTVGIAFVIFSILVVVYTAKRIASLKPAIRISEEGIYDYSYTNFGFIPWDDLEGVKKKRIKQNRYLLLFTKNPESILKRITNPRKKIQQLQQILDSPIFLTNSRLDCSFDELQGTIERRLNLHRKKNS